MALKFYKTAMGLKVNFPKEIVLAIFPKSDCITKAKIAFERAKEKWECYKASSPSNHSQKIVPQR